MCYSYESSLKAFIIAITSCILLWLRNKGTDRWSALFIGLFSLTQLLEAGLWKRLYDAKANQQLTTTILLLQWIYPTISAYIAWKYTKSSEFYYITMVSSAALLYTIYRALSAYDGQIHTIIDTEQNLQWVDDEKEGLILGDNQLSFGAIWFAAAALPLLYMDNTALLALFFGGAYILSKYLNPEYPGSLWCYYSTYLGYALLLF